MLFNELREYLDERMIPIRVQLRNQRVDFSDGSFADAVTCGFFPFRKYVGEINRLSRQVKHTIVYNEVDSDHRAMVT